MSVSWEALCEDIRRARPPLSWELISQAHRYIEGNAGRDSNPHTPIPGWSADVRLVSHTAPDPKTAPGVPVQQDKPAASEEIVMAKPKPPPGKVPSKNGARHDANVIKVSNRWGKTGVESTGKHAKPPRGGGKK